MSWASARVVTKISEEPQADNRWIQNYTHPSLNIIIREHLALSRHMQANPQEPRGQPNTSTSAPLHPCTLQHDNQKKLNNDTTRISRMSHLQLTCQSRWRDWQQTCAACRVCNHWSASRLPLPPVDFETPGKCICINKKACSLMQQSPRTTQLSNNENMLTTY